MDSEVWKNKNKLGVEGHSCSRLKKLQVPALGNVSEEPGLARGKPPGARDGAAAAAQPSLPRDPSGFAGPAVGAWDPSGQPWSLPRWRSNLQNLASTGCPGRRRFCCNWTKWGMESSWSPAAEGSGPGPERCLLPLANQVVCKLGEGEVWYQHHHVWGALQAPPQRSELFLKVCAKLRLGKPCLFPWAREFCKWS